MKKILFILLAALLTFTVVGCDKSDKMNENNASQAVIVKMPVDDTVNGYRNSSETESTEMPDTLSENDVTVGSPSVSVSSSTGNDKSSDSYCANSKTKVFHKINCSSVKTMKDENKITTSDRAGLVSQGYKPCKRCNP